LESQPHEELIALRTAHEKLREQHDRTRAELELLKDGHDAPIGFLEETPMGKGVMIPIILSVIVHSLLIYYALTRVAPATLQEKTPVARYIELLKRETLTEAPGERVASAPISAPLSNANRRAATPRPTGEIPTQRPGDGSTYIPGASGSAQPRAQTSPARSPSGDFAPTQQAPPADPSAVPRMSGIDWDSAIRDAGKTGASGFPGVSGGEEAGSAGGEKGFAESGPISFESQWYDWGDYAEGMVRRIRVNWYANMPPLIRTGMQGVVVIRFTITRSGAITEITLLSSSSVPPYDFAAKKAIELSSPLAPLPKDFPNETEHVTAQFFYNSNPPRRPAR